MLNSVDDAFIKSLPDGVIRPTEARYLEEPRGRFTGQAGAIAAPRTVEELSKIIQAAARSKVPVVPYGGGTGLVAGQVMPQGPKPLIVSLERMRAMRGIWPEENAAVFEAGATIASIQEAAEGENRLFPLSYASDGTAQIGAALAVNSGGLNVLRYGTARDLCLGVEAVLPDGQIYHGLRRLRKDNTGYDLRNLLIGSEGTLGIITAASLRLFPRPTRRGTAFLQVNDPATALRLLARLRDRVGDTISAFELMSGAGLEFIRETNQPARVPFQDIPAWSVLVELGTSGEMDPDAILTDFFATQFEAGEISDGLIASNERERAEFWHLRETIPEGNRAIGAIASHDISLPLSEIAEFIPEGEARLARFGPVRVNAFGHLGDGNLHYNVFPPKGGNRDDFDGVRAEITRTVHDLVAEHGGSFSAEHGVGRLKVAEVERYGDPARLDIMRRIKTALDPNGIMNPGAVLDGGGSA